MSGYCYRYNGGKKGSGKEREIENVTGGEGNTYWEMTLKSE